LTKRKNNYLTVFRGPYPFKGLFCLLWNEFTREGSGVARYLARLKKLHNKAQPTLFRINQASAKAAIIITYCLIGEIINFYTSAGINFTRYAGKYQYCRG
jgi:hypothetical protein